MSNDFKPLTFPQWASDNENVICELYKEVIIQGEAKISPYEMSVLDFAEEMYQYTEHFFNIEEIDCQISQLPSSLTGGLA